MDNKVKEYLELTKELEKAEAEHKRLEEIAHKQMLVALNIGALMESIEKEIITEMQDSGCLTADYDTGEMKLVRVALSIRKQSPKPPSIEAVPDEYITTKEVKTINQAKIKADFMDAETLPNWLSRDDAKRSIAIRAVKRG
jgi:Holliday junction resolvase